MGKYRFRKMFFLCKNNEVISPNVGMTNAYQFKDSADTIAKQNFRISHHYWEDETKPVPIDKVEGFYLVHESLYEEILKKFDKDRQED